MVIYKYCKKLLSVDLNSSVLVLFTEKKKSPLGPCYLPNTLMYLKFWTLSLFVQGDFSGVTLKRTPCIAVIGRDPFPCGCL